MYSFGEKINFKSKLNQAEVSLLKDRLLVNGRSQNFNIKYDEISDLKIYKHYSRFLNSAVIEIKFNDSYLLLAATSLVLFNEFVITKRVATEKIYDELQTQHRKNA